MKTPHRRATGRRFARFLLAVAAAGFLMVPAAAAQAHDFLETTDPANGAAAIVDNHVIQGVKTGAPEGKYTVAWRVVPSDGHPIEGTFMFTAGPESGR